jgi:hypothetical protein
VPLRKDNVNIKPDYNDISYNWENRICDADNVEKKAVRERLDFDTIGNARYNGRIDIWTVKKKTYVSQYRDGCFYNYVGLLAID